MSGSNTVVIAAYISGMKTTKAVNWSIPIVNHLWLEDCWVQWRALSVGLEKYIRELSSFLIRGEALRTELSPDFPPGVDFSKVLGERGGVGTRGIELDLEKEEELLREDVDTRDLIAVRGSNGQKSFAQIWQDGMATEVEVPVGTGTSVKDAKEVEDAVGMDVDVGVDVLSSTKVKKSERERAKELSDEELSPSKVRKREGVKELSNAELSPSKSPENKRMGTKTKKTKIISVEDEDVEIVQEKPKLIRRAKPDKPGPSKSHARDIRDEPSELELFPKTKDKTKSRKKNVPPPSPLDGTGEDDEPKRGKGVAVDIPSKTRVVSVVIDANSTLKKKHGLPRTESLRVQADEASVSISPKRDHPTKSSKVQSTIWKDREGATTPPKRTAAVKAASALHDVMMPDLMNYVQEKKRGFKGKDVDRVGWTEKSKKRSSDVTEGLSGDDETERKRRRLNSDVESRPSKALNKIRARPAIDDESGDEDSTGGKAIT